ncbi:MAG: hypothetical protein ACNYVW_01860 [Methanosarcinales archaeon]
MKLKLTEGSELMFENAAEEPFCTTNRANSFSSDYFLLLLKEIDSFIADFEAAVGMNGAITRLGERLDEAISAGRTTVEVHLKNRYFSAFAIKSDTAYILMENYELIKMKDGLIRSNCFAYDFTVPRFMVTRPVHEDTHSHVHKTEYAELFAELVDKTRVLIEEKRPSSRTKIKKLPFELTAPIYVKEKEELLARKMQRFAINAFLKRYYERNPEWYGLLGVPLFLPPDPGVVEDIKRITNRKVTFKSGFLSTYRKTLGEYAGAIAQTENGIYEDARGYLRSRTEDLISAVQKCLEGDYSGLLTMERELVWRPGSGMKI